MYTSIIIKTTKTNTIPERNTRGKSTIIQGTTTAKSKTRRQEREETQ